MNQEAFLGSVQFAAFAPASAPKGWLPADGRLLQIRQYLPLFALIGTKYGGDGKTTFALPNLTAQAPAGCTYFIVAQLGNVQDDAAQS